jgi:GNAT superfamily N-acetyltransferase
VDEAIIREPREADWDAILDLANRSVRDVPGAGPQDAWLANRRSAVAAPECLWHRVVQDPATNAIVGYVSVEDRPDERNGPRVFIVTEPAQRGDLGARLLELALGAARERGARSVHMTEYSEDAAFLSFLTANGFQATRTFTLDEGAQAVVLVALLS